MRVITRAALIDFYTDYADSKAALEEWYKIVSEADWTNFADMKATFKSVDSVGNKRYVFNIKGNTYRLIALVTFQNKMVYIRFIGTHAEYDKIKNCSKV